MNKDLFQVIIEKEGVSDDSYKVVSVDFKDGTFIEKGDVILCIETSKTAIEIEAQQEGYIFYDIQENDQVVVGQTIAIITDSETFDKIWFASNTDKKKAIEIPKNELDINISKPAQKLIDLHTIDINVFKGKSFLTKEDVENYLSTQKLVNVSDLSINDKSIIIYGGGGHAKMCIEILKKTNDFEIVGIIDSKLPIGTTVLDVPIIGGDESINELTEKGLKYAALGVGAVLNHSLRRKLFVFLKEKGLFIPNLIHPSASVEPSAQLGEGNQIMQGAIIGSDVKIGDNCIINSGSIISHDSALGNNVHLAPGAIVAGNVTINNDTIIGMGATLFLGIKIGQNVIINNGINIFDDVADNEIIKNN
jgi:sugar O-acyltransferase (sialic acid O-acetyltransferase NeuD family)